MRFVRVCEGCAVEFRCKRPGRRFCGKSCSNRHNAKLGREFDEPFYARNAERVKERARVRYAADPEYRRKVLARVVASKHLGFSQYPCEKCGTARTDKHHEDYSQPLDVRWVCRSCHVREHIEELGSWGSGLRKV